MRLFAPGDSFEQGSPFIASATVQIMGATAHVSGFSGEMGVAHYRAFMAQLGARGVTELVVQRRKKIKHFQIFNHHRCIASNSE